VEKADYSQMWTRTWMWT